MSETAELTVDPNPVPADKQASVAKHIGMYVAIRDKINEIKERHKKELEEFIDLQDKLTGLLQSFMDTYGATSIKSAQGTCYTSTKYTASLADPEAFMKYVIETKDFDLLDRKANVTAVRAHVDEKGGLPPGVNLSSIEQVGVRRPTGK